MKKSIILAAVAALVLAGCTKNETYVVNTEKDAVSFGAYSGRAVTKAGPTDDINLKALAEHGFGVFATYSATDDFSEATNDFMYNQQVTSADEGATWTYSPVKYWPNPTNGQAADAQKVSFFAYAPYADPEATGAVNDYGVTGFEIDGATKHNIVNYTFAANKPNVDLMWGYKTKTGDPATYTVNLNLTRTTDNVKFIFQHLLSKLGGSQEGAITDPANPAYVANGLMVKASPISDPTAEYGNVTLGDFGGAKGTKITISDIKVESAPDTATDPSVKDIDNNDVTYATGAQTGKLDLYTGKFTLDSPTPQAIKFSQELSADAAAVAADENLSEIADFLKEVPGVTDFNAVKKGVTKQAVNVYKDESNPIILIPGTKPVVDITVTYVVRTYDEKLPKGFSEVSQKVFGRLKFPEIEKNKKYNILMILGLNSVEFKATVEDWTSETPTWTDANGNGVVDPGEMSGTEEIWLPNNL